MRLRKEKITRNVRAETLKKKKPETAANCMNALPSLRMSLVFALFFCQTLQAHKTAQPTLPQRQWIRSAQVEGLIWRKPRPPWGVCPLDRGKARLRSRLGSFQITHKANWLLLPVWYKPHRPCNQHKLLVREIFFTKRTNQLSFQWSIQSFTKFS